MLRSALPNAWYGDCRLDGQLAYLVNVPTVGWRVQVNDRQILPLDARNLPLYLRVTDTGPLKLAGQGSESGWAVQYADGAWTVPQPSTYGVNPLIYTGQTLALSTVDKGSQGLRYVADDGTIISGDQTVNSATAWAQACGVVGPLWEWSHFGGLTIGQGETGCIAEWQGRRYVISPGQVYFIRVRRQGSAVAVYLVKPGAGEALWFDVAELGSAELPLEPVPVPPDPKPPDPPVPAPQPPPQITVHFYEPLLKAGVPWAVDFSNDGDGTRFVVSKDERDQLWIEAENAAGSTATGAVRQLTVEGPDDPDPQPPEPEPPTPPGTLGRFWLQPNIGSLDLAQILDDPSRLDAVDAFAIPVQQILTDETTDQLGPNTYPNLVAAGFFTELPVPLVVEMGSIKPYDCLAQNAIADMQKAVQRVADAGGVIAAFSADEPLTANQWPVERGGCHQSLEACADAHAHWTHAIRALGEIAVGYLEAWPEVALADIETFLHLLAARDARPAYWHLDVDWVRAENEGQDPETFLHAAQAIADECGIVFGAFVNATVDPIATDPAHHQNLLDLTTRIVAIEPAVAHVCVAAWATRDGTLATQNVPNNLGAAGLLDTFGQVRARFTETPPPEPQAPGGDMLYATLIEPTTERGPVVVKQVKPTGAPGLFTLILPDDRVFSMIPTGEDGDQAPGTAGAYEKCTVSGNAATFRPEPDKVFVRFFALVAGL